MYYTVRKTSSEIIKRVLNSYLYKEMSDIHQGKCGKSSSVTGAKLQTIFHLTPFKYTFICVLFW